MKSLSRFSLAVAALGLAPAAFAGSPSDQSRNVKVTLVSERASISPGQAFTLALKLEMAPEWHTYWVNPGDSGLVTKIRWTLPTGFEAGSIQWPVPERIVVGPLVSYGYDGEAWLLVGLRSPADAKPGTNATIAAKVDWLECKEACIPGKAQLELSLPVAAAAAPGDTSNATWFAEARKRLPAPTTGWQAEALASPEAIALSVARAPGVEPPQQVHFFPLGLELIDYAAEQKLALAEPGFRVELRRAANAPVPPASLEGVLVVDGRGFSISVPLREGRLPATAAASTSGRTRPAGSRPTGLGAALGLAFAGGLLLNLMPCVLPVLSLKVMSFVKHGGQRHSALPQGLAFTAGVLVFFWALAGALVALRAGGEQIGWGFQLQSPAFVAFLASLFLLMALNLFSVFEVGESLSAVGNLTARHQGLAGSFWGGALATLTATPCTAPFMGSALGFALAQPPLQAFLVFTALGLGMASPYLVLSASPRLLRFVPRPGRWMETFKHLMGFLLLGTVAFLVWLFGRQTGVDGVAWLLPSLLLVALGAWLYGRSGASQSRASLRLAAIAVALTLVVGGTALAMTQAAEIRSRPANDRSSSDQGGIVWQAWSPEKVSELRAAGTPVFVDFTADWCLTCQVNERIALGNSEVVRRFVAAGVVMLKADWTLRDERITMALEAFGRQGVPVYVLYGRDATREPLVLPEVLDAGTVLQALDEAL